jgi:hypothetical protein
MAKRMLTLALAMLLAGPAMASPRPYDLHVVGPGGNGKFDEESRAACVAALDKLLKDEEADWENFTVFRHTDVSADVIQHNGAMKGTMSRMMYRCLPAPLS